MRLGVVSAALALLAVPAAGQDLIVLRDGTHRTGALQSCIGDRCRLGGATIPLAEIAWIGFDQTFEVASPARVGGEDLAILRDGSERRGKLLGISLGTVAFERADLDRHTVARVHLADPTAGSAPPPPDQPAGLAVDALAMRDGSTRVGELVACSGGTCYLEGQGVIPRQDVAVIVFGGGGEGDEAPTPAAAGEEDRLIFRQGAARDGAVYGVSPVDVVAVSGTHDRSAVAAIVFAAEPAPRATGGVPANAADGEPPQAPPAAPPPAALPDLAPAPAREAIPGDAGGGVHGALWSGSIEGSFTEANDERSVTTRTFSLQVRLRETVHPGAVVDGKTIFQTIELRSEEALFSQTFATWETTGSRHCSGHFQAHGEVAGHLLLKTRNVDLTPYIGVDLPLNGGYYLLGTFAPIEDYTAPCDRPDDWNAAPFIGSNRLLGRNPRFPWVQDYLSDPEVRYVAGGRMVGSYETSVDGRHTTASWSLCREGADCPLPPALPDETPLPFDPCGRSGQQAALSENCQARLEAMVAALGPALAEYNARTDAAEANRDAFQEAQNYCALYDTAKDVLEAILTGGAGPAADAARALLYLRGIIEKAQSGNLGSMLYPDQVKEFLGYYNQAKEIWFELTADEITKMQSAHDACSGKVPIETYLEAKQFLADLAGAKQVWDTRVAPGLNELRTMGLACASMEHEAWSACITDAACRSVPPECGPEPSLAGVFD